MSENGEGDPSLTLGMTILPVSYRGLRLEREKPAPASNPDIKKIKCHSECSPVRRDEMRNLSKYPGNFLKRY